MQEEDEQTRIRNNRTIAAGGLLLLATGISVACAGGQLLFLGAIKMVKWLAYWKLLIGVTSMVVGLFYTSHKSWAITLAPVLAIVLFLYMVGWGVYGFLNHFYALITVFCAGLALVTLPFVLLSVKHARRYQKEYEEMFNL